MNNSIVADGAGAANELANLAIQLSISVSAGQAVIQGSDNLFTGPPTQDDIHVISVLEDPLLGPLSNNGGPTQTMLPGANSPALGFGNAALLPNGVNTDQRGLPRIDANRPAGANLDLGAVEIQTPPR